MSRIHLDNLSDKTADAWRELLTIYNPRFGGLYWPIELACLAYHILKLTRDTPAVFPKGKWASIQHLEALINAELAGMGLEAPKNGNF